MALAVTALQAQGAIHMQPLFEEATRSWRKCWQKQYLHNLDAEEVYDKFHVLLHLTTTMRVPPPLDLERQETMFGRHGFQELPVSQAFDRRVPVLVNLQMHYVETDNDSTSVVCIIKNVQCEYKVAPEFLDNLDAQIHE